jgi:hypothetical protein
MDEWMIYHNVIKKHGRFIGHEHGKFIDLIPALTDNMAQRIAELEAQNAKLLEFVRKTAELNSRESFNINWYGTRARALLAELEKGNTE